MDAVSLTFAGILTKKNENFGGSITIGGVKGFQI